MKELRREIERELVAEITENYSPVEKEKEIENLQEWVSTLEDEELFREWKEYQDSDVLKELTDIWVFCIGGPYEEFMEWVLKLHLNHEEHHEINFWRIGYVEGEVERIKLKLLKAPNIIEGKRILDEESLYHQTIDGELVVPYDDPEGATKRIRIRYSR